jgi:hypothetical protein
MPGSTSVSELESGLTTKRVAPSAVMAMAELARFGGLAGSGLTSVATGAPPIRNNHTRPKHVVSRTRRWFMVSPYHLVEV